MHLCYVPKSRVPHPKVEAAGIDLHDPAISFLLYGGRVMLDYRLNIVGVRAVTPFQQPSMMQFGPPIALNPTAIEALSGRWHKVRAPPACRLPKKKTKKSESLTEPIVRNNCNTKRVLSTYPLD
eukprot:896051-Prorocentrum_minimum.AAC.1